MDKSWPYIAGVAIFALTPFGSNDFARGLWGIGQEAEAPKSDSSANVGVGPQGMYTPDELARRERAIQSMAGGGGRAYGEVPAQQPLDPRQTAARAILSSPDATLREVAWASQVLRGETPTAPAFQPARSAYRTPAFGVAGQQAAPSRPNSAGPTSATAYERPAYSGLSGANYRYDLNQPADRMRYVLAPMALFHDSMSIDPRSEIDRSVGQQGGGIES